MMAAPDNPALRSENAMQAANNASPMENSGINTHPVEIAPDVVGCEEQQRRGLGGDSAHREGQQQAGDGRPREQCFTHFL